MAVINYPQSTPMGTDERRVSCPTLSDEASIPNWAASITSVPFNCLPIRRLASFVGRRPQSHGCVDLAPARSSQARGREQTSKPSKARKKPGITSRSYRRGREQSPRRGFARLLAMPSLKSGRGANRRNSASRGRKPRTASPLPDSHLSADHGGRMARSPRPLVQAPRQTPRNQF